MIRQVRWVVPGLLPYFSGKEIPVLPTLDWAWGRGRVRRFSVPLPLSDWQPDGPRYSQAERSAVLAGVRDQARQWLFADPVHLSIEGLGVVAQGPYALDIRCDEAEGFCRALNEQFVSEDLHFYPLATGQWLVGASQPVAVETTPLLVQVGKPIDGDLPRGEGRDIWLSRFNLSQMVLHEHPLNRVREAEGKRVVNGVWFWDEQVPTLNDDLWLGLREPAVYGDHPAWCAAVQQFEREIWAPLLADWRAGKLEALTLVALEGQSSVTLELRPFHRWCFWRGGKSLKEAMESMS